MRRSALLALLPLLAAGARVAHAQDFDPHGRHRPPSQHHALQGPARPAPEATSPQALIERYTRIVLAQPGAPFPLQRLAQLYRERDGSLARLITDLQQHASAGDPYPATVALAGIAKLDGRADDAIRTYETAVSQHPRDPTALLALGHLLEDKGDLAGARARFESALALQTVAADRAQTLRSLMGLALDGKDWDAAKRFHDDLVRQEPNSLFVRGELGRELYAQGEFARAAAALEEVVRAAAGDNRTLAPALKDLGQAQAKAHDDQAALATLERALTVAGPAAAVRAEIYQIISEVYRETQSIPTLIKKLEDAHPHDYVRLALLGSLYEETGDATHALASYKAALAVDPRQIDLRLKMIRLLQAEGELDQAIAAYEGIIRAAPDNPQFVFEMCDALIQRGDRARALRLLNDLEARAGNDEEILSRLGEFYTRVGEGDRAVKVLERLAATGGGDPSHLADLGDHYYQEGNTQLAVATWKRILTTVTPRARALEALGNVYSEHDMLADALVVLREAAALEPENLALKKDLATVLERSKAYREAGDLWTLLAEKAQRKKDTMLAREVRSHLVTLWTLEHSLERHAVTLKAAFDQEPPDIEAGRTLAEALVHLRRLPESESVLRRVVEKAPGDAEAYLALERVLVQEGKLDDAIAVLAKLVQVEPKRARELYQRMAQYAVQVYKDDDAIKYAARAVELNPDDAEGHRRLGDMYRSRQDTVRAIQEYRAAIQKNDRLFLVYFELADLLLSSGQSDEADRLFRRVVRGAPDDELVARAARLSMQINLGKGTLASLEQDLLPLAIGNPQKPVYRRLLVEMYGNITFGLVQRVRHGTGKEEDDARAALQRVGQRAVKPLLDALSDQDVGQQRIALDVLAYVANKNAGPSLFGYATGTGDASLRLRAMVACGALRDPQLLPRYASYLLPKGAMDIVPSDPIAEAATWGVARLMDKQALPLLRKLARVGSPEVRALAVLGLGGLGDKSEIPDILAIARAVDAGNVARAAAAYALGVLGATGSAPLLVSLAEDADPLPRQMALLSLGRLEAGRAGAPGTSGVVAAMADAVFAAGDVDSPRARTAGESLRKAAAAAMVVMAAGPASAPPPRELFPVPDGPVRVDEVLESLVPTTLAPRDLAKALAAYEEPIRRAALSALETSSDRAEAVLDAIAPGKGALLPFVGPEDGAGHDDVHAKSSSIVLALTPSLVLLARHPDPHLRSRAIALLAGRPDDAAQGAIIAALSDPSEDVQRAALSALGRSQEARSAEAAGKLLTTAPSWTLRVLSAEALEQLGPVCKGTSAVSALQHAASADEFALVREAALRALFRADRASATTVAARLAKTDVEPRIRELAVTLAEAPSAP